MCLWNSPIKQFMLLSYPHAAMPTGPVRLVCGSAEVWVSSSELPWGWNVQTPLRHSSVFPAPCSVTPHVRQYLFCRNRRKDRSESLSSSPLPTAGCYLHIVLFNLIQLKHPISSQKLEFILNWSYSWHPLQRLSIKVKQNLFYYYLNIYVCVYTYKHVYMYMSFHIFEINKYFMGEQRPGPMWECG